jgi:hypothetical protein
MDQNQVAAREVADSSPAALMIKAVAGGMDISTLERMLTLQERYEANEARKAYTEAMASFKKNPPEIEKDRHVSFKTSSGVTEYNHASLGNVTAKINAALGMHGLSAAWTTEQTEKGVMVTCKITHIMGHFETTSLTAANDASGGKNSIQALGSTISYLQRYTILALTGLATHEMDDDGGGPPKEPEFITEKQLSTIVDLLNEKGINETRLLKYLKVESADKIIATDYQKAVASIKATPAKGQAA